MFSNQLFSTKLRALSYILIADDDLDDQELIRDALVENNIDVKKLQFVGDGVELIQALERAQTLPSLILLDLNMPRKGGKEVLTEIRNSDKFRHIPIIIFSTSDSDFEIKQCYSLGSNAFMTKPLQYQDLVESMKMLTQFWIGQARLVFN